MSYGQTRLYEEKKEIYRILYMYTSIVSAPPRRPAISVSIFNLIAGQR